MKKIIATLLVLLIALTYGEAQTPEDTNKARTGEKRKAAKRHDRIQKEVAVIEKSKTDSAKVDCHCSGTSYDTCCPPQKICCKTDLIDDEVPNTYILQKNFGDASTFSYKYFKLNGTRENLCIRICNINRLAYDITADGQIIKVSLPDSNILEGLLKTYKGSPVIAPAETKTETDSTTADVAPVIPKTVVVKTPFEVLKEKTRAIKQTIDDKAAALSEKLKKLEQFARFAKNVPVIVGSECCSQQTLKLRLGNQADIRAVKEGVNYNNLSSTITVDIPIIFEESKDLAKQVTKEKKALVKLIETYKKAFCKKRIDTIKISRTEIISRERQLPSQCDSLPELQALDNEDEIDSAVAIADKADKNDLGKVIASINDILAMVDNDNNFFYPKCFKKTDAEFIDILFKAIPKQDYKNKLDSVIYTYTVPVTGRFKWAIGPSLNFHFGGTLVNNSFSLDSARNAAGVIMKDTFSVAKNSQRSRVVPYIGFMAHFYWQRHSAITPGITIGISTSPTQLSDLRTYLGVSAIIGGPLKGKLIFSTGLSGTAVDRLKPNLVEGLNPKNRLLFNGNNLPGPEQLVEKVFRIGFFFGFTYNLKD